jgi:hypothetical protein
MKLDYNNLVDGVKNNDPAAIQKLNDIKTSFKLPADSGIEAITPSMSYGRTWYTPTVVKDIEDTSVAEMQMKTENEKFDRYYKGETLANQKNKNTGGLTFEHPYATINKVFSNIYSYKAPTAKNVSFQPKSGDVDVTREYSSYLLPTSLGGKTRFRNVLVNKGNPAKGIQPFITYTTNDDPSNPVYTSAEQFGQLLVKTSPDVTFKGAPAIIEPSLGNVTTTPTTVSYSVNNKIYSIPVSEEAKFIKQFPNAQKQ